MDLQDFVKWKEQVTNYTNITKKVSDKKEKGRNSKMKEKRKKDETRKKRSERKRGKVEVKRQLKGAKDESSERWKTGEVEDWRSERGEKWNVGRGKRREAEKRSEGENRSFRSPLSHLHSLIFSPSFFSSLTHCSLVFEELCGGCFRWLDKVTRLYYHNLNV